MKRPSTTFSAMTRKVQVDNHISLRSYYRIADNLLKQASIYTQEKRLIDLYIILLRYSSLVSETIPYHRDYHALHEKERASCEKELKPKVRGQLDELEKVNNATEMLPAVTATSLKQSNGPSRVSSSNSVDLQFHKLSLGLPLPKQETISRHSFLGLNGHRDQWLGPNAEMKVNYPKNGVAKVSDITSLDQVGQHDTIAGAENDLKLENSRMKSFLSLGTGRWLAEESGFPLVNGRENNIMLQCSYSLDQVGQPDTIPEKENDQKLEKSRIKSFLSLDVGSWFAEESGFPLVNGREKKEIKSFLSLGNSSWLAEESDFPLVNGRENKEIKFENTVQLSPPPVMAQMQKEILPVSPHLIADPRPGPPVDIQRVVTGSNSYQDLHIPVMMMEEFLRVARENTAKNLETCGVLAGYLRNRVFNITTLIIPKQESTSDSCQTLNEEEIFEVQNSRSLFQLGWIHTHPTQTCFMSSVDLHTHYAYQVMLPEAIAIVMAPTDSSSPHGIFHLSNPGGVSVIRNCEQRGFHPHEKTKDGSPLYEHCSHVYMNANLKFDVVDLRRA